MDIMRNSVLLIREVHGLTGLAPSTSGGPNGGLSSHSFTEEGADTTTRSSSPSPPLGDTETLKQVEEQILTEARQTSSTSHTVQPANIKPTTGLITSKYKSKEEKKKARQARRKANRAKYCSKRGNTLKPPNAIAPVSKEKCSLENVRQGEIPKEQPPTKPLHEGITADNHRSSINKCRHLAVAIRREDKAPVDKELAKLIRKRLTDLIGEEVERILTTKSSGRVIQFKKSGLVSTGFFLVTPATEEARDWLLSRDFGLLDGTRVVAKKLERKKGKSKPGGEKRFKPHAENKSAGPTTTK